MNNNFMGRDNSTCTVFNWKLRGSLYAGVYL